MVNMVDKICAGFLRQADCDQRDFWMPAVLEPVVEIICLTFEELSASLSLRPDILQILLNRIKIIYDRYANSDQNANPDSAYRDRSALINEMMESYVSLYIVLPVINLVDFSLGKHAKLEKILKLPYIHLEHQKPALRKLMSICLDYFEAEVREQIAAKAAAEAQIEAVSVRESVAEEVASRKGKRRPREVEPQAAADLEKRPRRAAFLAAQRMFHAVPAVPDAADAAVKAPQPPVIRV